MEHDLFVAFELMGVGMLTVFLILALVVFVGNLIIKIVNRYFPESEGYPSKKSVSFPTLDGKVVSVLTAAVQVVTLGKGRISKIEKL